jgi:hypothetical protein
MNRRLLIVVVAVCLAVPALADVVHLKSGGTLEGQVTRTPDGVVVKLPAGEVRISNDAIARIEKKPAVLDEFQKRAAALKRGDVAAHFALAQWAQNKRLKTQARDLFQRVIALDPNHAQARHALGYRLVGGQWLTEEQQMKARGLVKHDGQWMTPEAAGKLRALKVELEVARERRLAAEAELKRAQSELEHAAKEPAYGENPYDRYYATRDLDRWRSRHYYQGTYYHSPYYYPSYYPYGGRRYYPGGTRYRSPSRR